MVMERYLHHLEGTAEVGGRARTREKEEGGIGVGAGAGVGARVGVRVGVGMGGVEAKQEAAEDT